VMARMARLDPGARVAYRAGSGPVPFV
jgi:hypothetical protein